MLVEEFDPCNLRAALNVLFGIVRPVDGMDVCNPDWWLRVFGADALVSFYAELRAENYRLGMDAMDRLLAVWKK